MRTIYYLILSITLSILFSIKLTNSSAAYISPKPAFQTFNLRILGPDNKPNPVVNENNLIRLKVVDNNGQPVTGVTFETGSPDIATIDAQTGDLRGVQRGFATITARRGNDFTSIFVAVSRVAGGQGPKVSGDTKVDSSGRIFISDPDNGVILKKDGFNDPATIFAGQNGKKGKQDGKRLESLFAAPTAVSIDSGNMGGIYIADTLSHSIRKINTGSDLVETIAGTGSPGTNLDDVIPFEQASFRSPRGVATDLGGDLIVADTDNHAIYVVNKEKREVRLLAGSPGMSGLADGKQRAARFLRPAGITISPDGRSIGVADTGNNRCRLITRDGTVTTVGRASGQLSAEMTDSLTTDQQSDGIAFRNPRSISFDDAGNLYVVDDDGVEVVTTANQVLPLAQPGTFGNVTGVVVKGTRAIVLDSNPPNNSDPLKEVTVGAPQIISLNIDRDRLEGGAQVIITGKNFSSESIVVLGDKKVNANIVSATEIRFTVPKQDAPGKRTLSVRTRGGLAQREFTIFAKTLAELAVGEITTIAGGVPFIGDGGMAAISSLRAPQGLAIDSAGNVYISDTINNRIRRVDSTGVITTIAGNGTPSFNGDGDPATSAGLNSPVGILIDNDGNLLIADQFNQRIRRVDIKDGTISTIAGKGIQGFGGDGGLATNAMLSFPSALAIDSGGNLFISDSLNNRIRRVDAKTGIITTVVGTGDTGPANGDIGDGRPATSAFLFNPIGLALDQAGNLFIADTQHSRIRRVDTRGTITTVAGNGREEFSGDGGPAVNAGLFAPLTIAVDGTGNLLITDFRNNRIRLVNAQTGIITTIAGSSASGLGGDGGPAVNARLGLPTSIALDNLGNVYISEQGNNRIRLVSADTGIIRTMVGTDIPVGDGDKAVSAILANPKGIAVDRSGNFFISDRENHRIRRVDSAGNISTVAGTGIESFSGEGGPAANAGLAFPGGITFDAAGNLLIADTSNQRIRRVDANTGFITTVAGNGKIDLTGDGGPAVNASLAFPDDIAIDGSGNIFIADRQSCTIRRVDGRTGIITTLIGNGGPGFGGDNGPANRGFLNLPQGVTLDRAGNLFIADTGNQRIRRIDARTGIITTIAGNGLAGFQGDGGPANRTSLNNPLGMVFDGAGNLYIAEEFNQRIRRVDPRGNITTVAGNGEPEYTGDGGSANKAGLAYPKGLAFDAMGNLYIGGGLNNAIRVIKGIGQAQSPLTITNAVFNKPNLIITGTGFGSSGAVVSVNGVNLSSSLIMSQNDTQITLKGNKKKLNLKKGQNQVSVTINGVTSNTFVFNF